MRWCWACPYMKIEMKSVSTSDINVLFIDECILRISQISTNKQSLNILFKNLHVNVSIFIFMTQHYFILSRWTELTELDIRHTMQVSFTFSKINILFWPYLLSIQLLCLKHKFLSLHICSNMSTDKVESYFALSHCSMSWSL